MDADTMPLRVLFNTYPLAFACPGGGEVQLQSCREALQRRGIIVELFDPWHPQFDQADVVHFFSVQGGSIPFCDYVKRRGLPLVLSPILWLGEDKHDYALEEIGALLRLCDLALPNSVEEGRLLATYYGLEDAKFVPIVNGADVRFHLPADPRLFRETYGVNGEFLLCLANIEPRKNQLQLIRAVRDLTMPVLLVGRIRDTVYWEACQQELPPNVRYLGPIEFASELHRSAYCACSLFVLPTRLETPGLAALEAAALGARICITREGCTREYFGEEASYVDPDDPADILRGIREALTRLRTDTLSRTVRKRYTWDRAAEQLASVYTRLTGKPC